MSERLQDRREVAAGTRAQVLGFEDGRFYANGWHITGEMGGIVTPPLKLLDTRLPRRQRPVGRPGHEVHERVGATSRYALPSIDGLGLERTDVAPDGRRGALIGLKLTNPSRPQEDRQGDGRRPLRADDAVPVGLRRDGPQRERQRARSRRPSTGAALVFRDTGRLPGETGNHSYTAIVGSDRDPVGGTRGPATTAPSARAGAAPPTRRPRRCPASATTARSAAAPAAGSATRSRSAAGGSTTVWIAVAGSENSVARGAQRVPPR